MQIKSLVMDNGDIIDMSASSYVTITCVFFQKSLKIMFYSFSAISNCECKKTHCFLLAWLTLPPWTWISMCVWNVSKLLPGCSVTLHSSPFFSAIQNFLLAGSYKNELHWSEIKITLFWDVMLCSLAYVTSTSEEPAVSIFMVEE
jgi:hypothetical protein